MKGGPLMRQRTALNFPPGINVHRGIHRATTPSSLEQQFIEELRLAFGPQIKALIKEVIEDEAVGNTPLIVDYAEAGRLISTTYEGVRKLVRKGMLTAVSRSGRYRGIAISELKDYIQRSRLVTNQ
jgi:hypothetical protein